MRNWNLVQEWLSAIRQQAITWPKVDPDLGRHMASLQHNVPIKYAIFLPGTLVIGTFEHFQLDSTPVNTIAPDKLTLVHVMITVKSLI